MIASAPGTGGVAGTAGRRERKKQRTREALVDAAFTLFAAKGYDATTVEEIADAVDVSARTFFRYFASKEDVALTVQEEQRTALLAALAARPAQEPPLTALRNAVVTVTRRHECDAPGPDRDRFRLLLKLLGDGGGLLAGSLEHAQRGLRDIALIIARRMGTDAASDLRPYVLASTMVAVFQAALIAVKDDAMGYTSLADALSDAFAALIDEAGRPG